MAEHREKHGMDYWPKRNDPLRATVVPQMSTNNKDEMNNNTLSRCRSLEFLEDGKYKQTGRGNLHRSFDLLMNQEQHEAIIHHDDTSKSSSIHLSTNTSESERKSKKYTLDFRERFANDTHSTLSDAESLEDFTNKTKEIIQMKRASRQQFKERTLNELRKPGDNPFLEFAPQLGSTLTADSMDDLRAYRSTHYPNDFDDISVEMRNITKLLSASFIEPLESAPSTSSSFYHSIDSKRFTLYDKDDDTIASSKSDIDFEASNSYLGGSNTNATNTLGSNGFFQNTCFEHQSSSSCDTLKSAEKTNGNTNGNDDEDEDESDTDLEETTDEQIKMPPHLQSITHRNPRPGLVSARIKSLLAKNLQTHKSPTVRSSLVGNASHFKHSKLLRVNHKPSDSHKAINNTLQSKANGKNSFDDAKSVATGDSSDNEAQITVHKATVHQIHTDSNDERTNIT